MLHAARFLILLFTQFPPVSISLRCSLHSVYFPSLSFFLSILFLRIHLHFSVCILSFPLLLFLCVHYFFLFVCCVRNTLVTAQFTSVLFKPLKGIQWRWHVTAPSSEEHDVCSIYSYSAVWVSGSIHRAIGLLSNGERAEFHRQLAVFMQAHNQYSLCVMDGDFSATAASRYRSPSSTETAASWIFITTNEVSYDYICIYTFILLRASTDHGSTTVVRNFTFLQLKELPSKSGLSFGIFLNT